MRYRPLGGTGLRVSRLFLGAMTFGSPEEARRVLDVYGEAGGNVIDTADFYGDGRSESVLGELLRGRRDRFVVATKFGVTRDPADPNAAGAHRKNLRAALEASLRRLRTDHVDLYWVHLRDPHTPIEETLRALDDAVRSGKVLAIGISDAPAWLTARAATLAEWRGLTPLAALQAPYSLLTRDVERELLPMAEALGMTVAAWGPLGHGVLTGKYTPHRGSGGSSPQAAVPPARLDLRSVRPEQHAVAREVREVAASLGATPAQVAIAWTLHRSPAVHPVVGARTAGQLRDTLGALDVALPQEAMERLEAATGFALGFPGDFLARVGPEVFGHAHALTDGPARA
ncbi:aldo/keto reductase [Thermoactinospora rubra]|uniref:aldo/keto reductase n=1 Tax=Thermoactinospora rubra TaxID=1088767 RepID=UPI000A0F456B|nr:aldo/keto reductase [Thermoactinospora rubra]